MALLGLFIVVRLWLCAEVLFTLSRVDEKDAATAIIKQSDEDLGSCPCYLY